jgi:4-amino-4-deoxy-L-arabinose transferase-like glycosyltransferase
MAVTTGGARKEVPAARSLAAVTDFATRSHARALALLVVVALISILPGFFAIPPTDRDESRFAHATKQMIETGEYVDIRFQDDVRYKKPAGIYWLQAGVVKAGQALGVSQALTTIWLYRIPSLVGALAAVLLTYWAALAFVTRRAAVFAGLMMASCLLLSVEGRIAKTDAMLLAAVVAAMGAMARAYLPEQRRLVDARASWMLPAIFWTALAAGVLLKGPVIVLFVGLAALTLLVADRSARWLISLRPLVGVVWFALLVLPWFLAIVLRSGDSFLSESVGRDLLLKVVSGQESHGAPPGYYALLYWGTFFPGAMLTGLAAPAIWAARREPGARFLLAWVVPSWIVLEIVVTKLPHYVLPVYPAIAILLAGIMDARTLSRRPWLKGGTIWWFLMPLLASLAGLFALFTIGRQFGLLVWPVIGASLVMGLLAWRLYDADGPEHSLLRAVAAALLLVIALFGLIVPALAPVFPSVALAKLLRESGCDEPVAASAGYHEPSLVFLAGTATRLTDGAGAAEFLRGGDCRFAFVELRQERNFGQRADAIGLLYSQVGRIEAFNTGSGKSATIMVYRSGGPR